jgi:hypothetical protein
MSKLEVKKYVRKPFEVEAIQVTRENFDQVAQWCKGNKQTLNDGTPYIKVKVFKPMGDRQTEAHIGDWILFMNGGYKVYLDQSFTRTFEEVNNGGTFNNILENAQDVPESWTEDVKDGVRTITSARVESVSLEKEADPSKGVHPIQTTTSEVPVEDLRVK